ncbi:MAG: RDD family protein [Halodesulfurarchaeum sp.]|nr:RDD family protein [Halodesulfurarchaeum sp.]
MVRAKPRHDGQPASLISRAIAFLVDGTVVGLGTALLFWLVTMIAPRAVGLVGLLAGAGGLLYFIALEGAGGQTVGKRMMGIAVVKSDGRTADMKAATVRNLLRIVDSVPAFYAVGIVVMLLAGDGKRLGDLVGDTMVVSTGA